MIAAVALTFLGSMGVGVWLGVRLAKANAMIDAATRGDWREDEWWCV